MNVTVVANPFSQGSNKRLPEEPVGVTPSYNTAKHHNETHEDCMCVWYLCVGISCSSVVTILTQKAAVVIYFHSTQYDVSYFRCSYRVFRLLLELETCAFRKCWPLFWGKSTGFLIYLPSVFLITVYFLGVGNCSHSGKHLKSYNSKKWAVI